jgi:hypothetical protein
MARRAGDGGRQVDSQESVGLDKHRAGVIATKTPSDYVVASQYCLSTSRHHARHLALPPGQKAAGCDLDEIARCVCKDSLETGRCSAHSSVVP